MSECKHSKGVEKSKVGRGSIGKVQDDGSPKKGDLVSSCQELESFRNAAHCSLTDKERQLWGRVDDLRQRALAEYNGTLQGASDTEGESHVGVPAAAVAVPDRNEVRTGTDDRPPAVGEVGKAPARLLEIEQKSVDLVGATGEVEKLIIERAGEYEMRRCRCRSRFCEHCCLSEGLVTKKKVIQVLRTFKGLLMWTFTIDPSLFESPDEAYAYVRKKRCIGEWVRSMRKAGLLHSDRYFCVIEWQKNGWPHWHVLLDADFISIERGQARWDCFRPKGLGPVESGRPGFGYVFVSKRDFESPEHAANYACKYITKHPADGFPAWVLDSCGEVKRYWCSKGFYDCLPADEAMDIPCSTDKADFSPCCEREAKANEVPEKTTTKKIATTIRERLARCGHGVSLFRRKVVHFLGGSRITREFIKRQAGTDLEDVCEILGIDCQRNVWGILLSREEMNAIQWSGTANPAGCLRSREGLGAR